MRKIKRKGELSLNIIIVAVIGLLVLVVISVIFMQRMGLFGRGANDCESKGGTCASSCDTSSATLFATCYADDGKPTTEKCCKALT